MGNNPSKPTEHIFYGETPVQFSSNLVSTLEGSQESDSTRQKLSDLHIAQLVQSELQRLQSREDAVFAELSRAEQTASLIDGPGTDPDLLSVSRVALSHRVSEIRDRLERFPSKKRPEDEETKKTREELVNCLRVNDRRPLDCWGEVERFKEVVRRREGGFVLRVVK